MKLSLLAITLAATLAPGLALASPTTNHFSLFGGAADVEADAGGFGEPKSDGAQYGARARVGVWKGVYGTAAIDFSKTETDVTETQRDLVEAQVGVGYLAPLNDLFRLGAEVSYTRLDSDDLFGNASPLDGVRGSVTGSLDLASTFEMYGHVGYVRYSASGIELDGADGSAGFSLTYFDDVRVFIEYRLQRLSGEGEELDLRAARAGLRFGW